MLKNRQTMRHIYHVNHSLTKHKQSGVSVFIVLMMLILGLISVLSAVRVGILNEAFVGSDADTQRTFAAAEAMMRDAVIDVRGKLDNGNSCNGAANAIGCRLATAPHLVIKNQESDLNAVRDSLLGQECAQGICAPRNGLMDAFWNDKVKLDAMKPLAATYGQFTGASSAGNPILANRGWYWIEQYQYTSVIVATNRLPLPDRNFPFVTRITVVAEGNKAGSRTILQSYVIPRPQTI